MRTLIKIENLIERQQVIELGEILTKKEKVVSSVIEVPDYSGTTIVTDYKLEPLYRWQHAYSQEERKQARITLINLRCNSLDDEVRRMAGEEIRKANRAWVKDNWPYFLGCAIFFYAFNKIFNQ